MHFIYVVPILFFVASMLFGSLSERTESAYNAETYRDLGFASTVFGWVFLVLIVLAEVL